MIAPVPPALATYMKGLKSHDVKMIGSSLAMEVQFITPVKTMAKPAILDFLAALYRGFPDWSYQHNEPAQQEDGSFAILWQQGGTHTGTLAFPGFDAVEPTGKVVAIPGQHFFTAPTQPVSRRFGPTHSRRRAPWHLRTDWRGVASTLKFGHAFGP